MIPDKLYRIAKSGTVHLDKELAEKSIADRPDLHIHQYVLTPTEKKFSEEKPKEDGDYLCLTSIREVTLNERGVYKEAKTLEEYQILYYSTFNGCFSTKRRVIHWCEIILPKEISE